MTGRPKRWRRYAAYRELGDWHVHSAWSSDAEGTIEEYCRQAVANGLRLVAFTEHVRRALEFDYGAFVADVERCRRAYPGLVLLAGCEAKVLDAEGRLDAPEEVLARCDLVVASFHSFGDPSRYLGAVRRMLANPQVDVWGHPTLYARRQGVALDEETLAELMELCRAHDVLVEFNEKYGLPPEAVRALVLSRGVAHVAGSDAHSVAALRRLTGGGTG